MKKFSFIIVALCLVQMLFCAESEENRNGEPAASNAYKESTYGIAMLPIEKDDGMYIMGDRKMTKAEYFDYLQRNCNAAWQSYQKGRKLWKSGWVLFGIGSTFIVGGSIMVSNSLSSYVNIKGIEDITKTVDKIYYIAGWSIFGIGSTLTTASLPCLIVGGIKKYNSHRVYNNECAKQSQARVLDVGLRLSNNGIGLALIF